MITYIVLSTLLGLFLWRLFRRRTILDHLPGPTPLPLIGNAHQMDQRMPPITLHRWYKQYGSVYKVHFPEGVVVVVAGYDSVKEVLATRGSDFAGRAPGFRDHILCRSTACYANQPGDRLTAIRKLFFSFVKPYGSGMGHVESIASEIANELFDKFRRAKGEAFDPLTAIENATVKFMQLLMTGDFLEDEELLLVRSRELIDLAPQLLAQSVQGIILDQYPWFRIFGPNLYKIGVRCHDIVEEIWEIIQERQKKDPGKDTLARLLQDHVIETTPLGQVNPTLKSLHPDDAKTVAALINFAGGSTTAIAFYEVIKALLHYPEIQNKAHREITKVLSKNQQVTLQDRSSLPYICAIIKEAERFFTVAPLGLPHRSVVDTKILGFPIPKNTRIVTSLWSVHHDESFWGDPYNFRPERFLDEEGAMLPADHENVRHVLGFGAGPRYCPGEALASTRLFLWSVELIRLFHILPPDFQELGCCDPRDAIFGAPTRISNFSVKMVPRDERL